MDLYYETPREMLSLDEMLEGDLKFCLDEMEPELKDLNWSAGGGLENLTSWGGVIGSTGADYWSANCLTLSGQQQQAQQDHRLPAFDLTLTPENTPANKMVNPKSVIPSRIRSMQFEFEMEMMANDDDTDDDDDDEQEYHDRTIDVDDVEGRNVSTAGAAVDRRSPSPSGNEDEEDVVMKIEPRDQVEDEGLESSFEGSNHEIEVKTEKDVEEEVDLPSSVDASRAQVQRVFPTFQKTQMVKTSVNGAPHVMKQVPVRSQPVQVQRTAQGGKPRTLWLLKKQPPVKPNLQNSPPEKDVERIIKTQTVTNPNGVQILKPNLQKLKIISSSSSDSPQQLYISRTTALSSPPAVSPKITANGNSTPNSAASAPPTLQIGGRTFQKPPCSYSCLIVMALKNSETGCLPVSEIYSFMCDNFPFFQCAPPGWKNSVRHNLSMNDCFSKIEKDPLTMGPSASPPTQPLSVGSANVTLSNGGTGTAVAGGGLSIGNNGCGVRKGCLWAMNPGKVKKMDIELAKWSRKDPEGMRGAMKNPSDLDKLIKGELVVKTSSLKLEVKSEDEEDDCDNDDEDEEDALEKLVPTQIKRLSCERTREIVLEEDGFFPNEAEEQDDEAGESEDESSDSSSGEEEEEEEEIHMDLDYDSDSDEDRVPPSLKPFDLRHSSTTLDPLMTVENNNVSTTTTNKILASRPPTTTTTKILASRPLTTMTTTTATKSESAPKRPRLLSHQVKYVAVSKSPGLVTSALRQPMRLQ